MDDVMERHQKLMRDLSEKPKMNNALKLVDKKVELSAYRHERNLMLFPFCSTARAKRIKSIEYRTADGKRWLEVTANAKYGMVKIWDFDVLRFAFSKAGEIARMPGCSFPDWVDFTAYECLKAIGRDTNGSGSYKWLEEALKRLATTSYCGNVFREDESITTIFTLLEVVYKKDKNSRVEGVRIKFNERIVESARYLKGLLEIDPALINEDSGLKKRLLELVKVSKGNNSEWTIGLERLQALCAHDGPRRKYKDLLKNIQIPWKIKFSSRVGGGENITFYG